MQDLYRTAYCLSETCGNPTPRAPECSLLKSMCAANHKGFPPHGHCLGGTWDIILWQSHRLLHKVELTWPELMVLPSTGSSAEPVFLALEVLISLAGC